MMAARVEAPDSADPFWTPPWATRVLCELLLPRLGIHQLHRSAAWEPACGEGHMAEVLREYFGHVHASDLHAYGYGESGINFLHAKPRNVDWIITNPPFGSEAAKFVRRALQVNQGLRGPVNVATFHQLRWIETGERYEIFKAWPPTMLAIFAERVNCWRKRWVPDGGTATAYCWLIWVQGAQPQPPFWIPMGQRKALMRPDDATRFTAHPVIKR